MPRLRKTARSGRRSDARRDESQLAPAPAADAGSVVGSGVVTASELNAGATDQLPAELAAEFAKDSAGGAGGSVVDQAQASADAAAGAAPAVGADQAPASADGPLPASPALTAEQLLALCETGKALLVTLVGKAWKIPDEKLAELGKLDPSTRATLRIFAPDATRYLPAFTQNAPAIGAACFAGFLALDLYQTSRRLRDARPQETAGATRPASPRDAHGSRIVGAENLPVE